ncbi:MAG TPA: phosphodiester glycosidase family protein [Pyrinomonadaceae bacterium]|jgi:exopolysaccharide biosynthesis protein
MKSRIYIYSRKFFLSLSFSLFLAFFPVYVSAQEFQTIQDGIEYAKFTRKIKNEPVVVNLLRLDLSKVRLDVVHAADTAIGTETTSSMARRHGAFAAINAGFFRLDKSLFAGDAVGVLQVDGKLLSESYGNRIAFGVINRKNKTEVDFKHLEIVNFLSTELASDIPLTGINRERKEDEIILLTPQFGKTTLTDSNGTEIIVRKGKVTNIIDGKGNNEIPRDGFIVSVSEKKRREILPKIRIGKKLKINNRINGVDESARQNHKFWKEIEDITNGVPQLIKNGAIEITWEKEKSSKSFVETRHPRTAIAKLKDKRFLMVTVDGRQPGVSVGMNLNELAEMLLEFGATEAMNLDGGGSTTMFLNGKIVNQPSDKEGERKVSDAILVLPRKKR